MSTQESLAQVYAISEDNVRRSGFDEARAKEAYSEYVEYVDHFAKLKDKKTLDVGCGNGWSSFLLAQKNALVTGVDLHAKSFEPTQQTQKLTYLQGSATALPFKDDSFDIVTTHECLEHVEDPQRALAEFDRVLKSNGYICIVGPNLLSLLQSYRGLTKYVWQVRPLKNIFIRTKGMPSHPHGNTIWEILSRLIIHIAWIVKLYALKKPLMQMRAPDFKPPFHADNDACYFLNPLDLKYYFEAKGYEIINHSGKNRPQWITMLPSGTWFCAKKR